ncbi:MAG: hypothetical protein ABI602_04455 [Candidatus Saccharibacteria bacterium]
MSEFAPAPEKRDDLPVVQEIEKALPTAEQAEPLRENEANVTEAAVEAARDNVEEEHSAAETSEQDDPLERLQAAEKAAEPAQPVFVNADLKKLTLQREMNSVRRKLPVSARALSKVVHQPVVRVLSEVTGKTVTRPSGLLGGGILAFVGSAIYLYMTKHVGFSYNYFVFLLFFVGGFGLGLALELLIWVASARKRTN